MKKSLLRIGVLMLVMTPITSSAQEPSIQSLWQKLLQLQQQIAELFARQDSCKDLVDTSFQSTAADQVVGMGPAGVVLGRKVVTFGKDNTVSWSEGDVILYSAYTCTNNILHITSPGVAITARYHPQTSVLTWDSSNYERIENQ